MKLLIETNVGVSSKIHEHINPTIADLLDAINLMNGSDKSLITLENDFSDVMIGGGPTHFICTGNYGEVIVNALSDNKSDDLVTVVVGGQECDYASKYILIKPYIELIARELVSGNSLHAMASIRTETC
jgi:hypothetical protein